MASRAPTLAKPKLKAKSEGKVTSKGLVSKSSPKSSEAAKTSVAVKPSLTSKASTSVKSSLTKAAPVKTGVSKVSAAKPALLKTVATKTVAAKSSGSEATVKIAGAASFEKAAPKPRRRTKGEIRTRIYWAVFNQALRRVAVFEFDQRGEAEKRAGKLTEASGEHHFLQKIKAIVQ